MSATPLWILASSNVCCLALTRYVCRSLCLALVFATRISLGPVLSVFFSCLPTFRPTGLPLELVLDYSRLCMLAIPTFNTGLLLRKFYLVRWYSVLFYFAISYKRTDCVLSESVQVTYAFSYCEPKRAMAGQVGRRAMQDPCFILWLLRSSDITSILKAILACVLGADSHTACVPRSSAAQGALLASTSP